MKLGHMQRGSLVKMMEDGASTEEIATKFDASVEEVTEYINNIFGKYGAKSETSAGHSSTVEEEMTANGKEMVEVDEAVFLETVKLLIGIGMEKQDATSLLQRTIPKLNRAPVDAEELKNLCYQNFSPKDMMISTSENGNKGVMISTGAASNSLDRVDVGGKGMNVPQTQSMEGVYSIQSPIGSNQNTRKV